MAEQPEKIKFGEYKMNKKVVAITISIILFAAILQLDLGARVTSKIEGRVWDDETWEKLADVTVNLYYFTDWGRPIVTKIATTDERGKFIFNNLRLTKGYYFLQFQKVGYVDFPNGYLFNFLKKYQKYIELIKLKEGERRFVHARLKRGGTVKGTVYLKTLSGVNPIQNEDVQEHPRVDIDVNRKVKADEKDVFSSTWITYSEHLIKEDGTYFLNGLDPQNEYEIVFSYDGFFKHTVELEVSNPENFEINPIFDDTDKTGISVKVFVNNEVYYTDIHLRDILDTEYLSNFSLVNDRYIIKNAKPGCYYLSIFIPSIQTGTSSYISRMIPIEIVEGETTILDLNY